MIAAAKVVPPSGTAERDTALALVDANTVPGRRTVGADKAYDTREFVAQLRARDVTPHVTRNDQRPGGSAIDARTTRHPGYALSQCIRKRIEECFGWGKTIGGLRQTKYRGTAKVDFQFVFTMTAYNLVRLRNLLRPAPA